METIIHNIDSRQRNSNTYPNICDFSIELDQRIKNVVAIKMSSMEFGNTSHTFSSVKGNNTFSISYDGGASLTFTLEDGNYNSDDMVGEINTWLGSNVPNVTVAVDANTGLFTFTSSAATFSLSFNATSTDYVSLGRSLGYKETSYNSVDLKIISENIMNIIGEQYYFMKLNNFGNIFNNGIRNFSKIIMNAPKYEVVMATHSRYVTKEVKMIQPVNIKKLDVKVVDTFDNIIDQKGINFSFTLEFTVVKNDSLKRYKNLTFYSKDLMKIMLYDKMLAYYNKKDNSEKGNGLITTYQKILQNQVNIINKLN